MKQTFRTPQDALRNLTVGEFFKLPEVIALQTILKRNPFDSAAHREATAQIESMAEEFGLKN